MFIKSAMWCFEGDSQVFYSGVFNTYMYIASINAFKGFNQWIILLQKFNKTESTQFFNNENEAQKPHCSPEHDVLLLTYLRKTFIIPSFWLRKKFGQPLNMYTSNLPFKKVLILHLCKFKYPLLKNALY